MASWGVEEFLPNSIFTAKLTGLGWEAAGFLLGRNKPVQHSHWKQPRKS